MKKILVVAIAAVMLAVMATTAFAAETSVATGGWWSSWTPGYAIAVDETLEFDMEVDGAGEAGGNWNTFFAVVANVQTSGGSVAPNTEVEGYSEHVLLRADNYGWATYYNVDSGATVFTSDVADADEDGDTWDDFRAAYDDAHVDVTVERTATTMVFTYAVTGANGTSFTHTATQTFPEDLGDTYVFFGVDGSTIEVTPVEAAEEPETPEEPSETPDEPSEAPTTGFATIALAIVAIGSGAYIVSKKH